MGDVKPLEKTLMPSLPTPGETYALLLHHLREAQSASATLANLAGLNERPLIQRGWLAVQEQLNRMTHVITALATSKMH